MEAYRQIRSYKNQIDLIRGIIYFLAICLILLSIWKYALRNQEYLVLIMNVSSAFLFIILIEWSRHNHTRAFGYGVLLSIAIFIIYIWAFGYEFDLFTLDTLIFIVIDTAIKKGDNLIHKMESLNKMVVKEIKE